MSSYGYGQGFYGAGLYGGGLVPQYDPDHYLTSTIRAVADYVRNVFDAGIVTVLSEFPPPTSWQVPVGKVIVHFELDDDDPRTVGFSNGGQTRFTYDPVGRTTGWEEATAFHRLNFDVGVWSFQETGGSTARMEVQEKLKLLFTGGTALTELSDATNGINVISFSGGRHLTDDINGMPVWRVIDMTLIVEVCARRTFVPVDAIADPFPFEQDPGLVIDTDQPVVTP